MRASSIERRSLSMSCFGRELWKLHNSVNYNESKRKERSRQKSKWKLVSEGTC